MENYGFLALAPLAAYLLLDMLKNKKILDSPYMVFLAVMDSLFLLSVAIIMLSGTFELSGYFIALPPLAILSLIYRYKILKRSKRPPLLKYAIPGVTVVIIIIMFLFIL